MSKMASRLILLLLPAVAFASIGIELTGKFNGAKSNVKVYWSGSEVGVISDEERNSFNLGDNNVKNAVAAYFGKRPDEAYMRSPTPWGDLYQSFGWNQVIRTLTPKSAKILKISSEPVIVLEQIFENNSSKPATINVGISQSVENTASSSWSKGGDLTVGREISYDFDIEAVSVGGATSMSYFSSWGENAERSTPVTVGSSTSMELLLQPGQDVVSQLQATRGSIQVEVTYEASLSGAVAVNYDDDYKGHRFWALDVRAVMAAGDLTNMLKSREVIEIGFYSNAKVVVNDRTIGTKMLEAMAL